jgi:superoxide dismutase, Fe-Mn family
MKKRDFIKISLFGAASCAVSPMLAANSKSKVRPTFEAVPAANEIVPANNLFKKNELAQHHKLFFENSANYLNKLELNGQKSRKIFLNSHKHNQQAGAFYNHRIFFKTITKGGNKVNDTILSLLKSSFGSFNAFVEEFNRTALSLNGDGWVWLVNDKNTLKITSTKGNDNPIMSNIPSAKRGFPIIALDMWEHAYANSNKEQYLNAFWKSVNWAYVSIRHQRAQKANLS